MFYTSVMRDAATGAFAFAEPRGGVSRSTNVTPRKIREVTDISSVLLTPDLHPLIDEQVFALLNSAYERRRASDDPSVAFTSHTFNNDWAARASK